MLRWPTLVSYSTIFACGCKGQHRGRSLFPRSWLTRLAVTFEVVRPERPQLMQNCRTIASFPVQSPAIMDLEGSPLASLWIELLGCTSFSLLHLLLHSCTRDTRLHRGSTFPRLPSNFFALPSWQLLALLIGGSEQSCKVRIIVGFTSSLFQLGLLDFLSATFKIGGIMKWNIYNLSPAKNLKQLCHQRDFIRVIINSTEDYASSVIIEIDWTEFELTSPHLFKPRKIA